MIFDFSKSYLLPLVLAIVFLPVSMGAVIFNIARESKSVFIILGCFLLVAFVIGKQTLTPHSNATLTALSILTKNEISVTSTAFSHRTFIPKKYTCEGENISPPLTIANVPPQAKSLVLIMDDPDAPMGTFDHWIVWNITPTGSIPENTVLGIQGKNGTGSKGYTGPCPPTGTHRYFFKIYALSKHLVLEEGANKKTVEKAMKGYVLAKGELIGLYKKEKN